MRVIQKSDGQPEIVMTRYAFLSRHGSVAYVGVTYDDETDLNLDSVVFSFDGVEVPDDEVKLDPPAGGRYVHITYQIPFGIDTTANHEASVFAADLDQHTPGGDCGQHTWTFGVDPGTTPGYNTDH